MADDDYMGMPLPEFLETYRKYVQPAVTCRREAWRITPAGGGGDFIVSSRPVTSSESLQLK